MEHACIGICIYIPNGRCGPGNKYLTAKAWVKVSMHASLIEDDNKKHVPSHSGTSTGPAEAVNGRRDHPRGPTLGFLRPAHNIIRSLLNSGGYSAKLHRHLR